MNQVGHPPAGRNRQKVSEDYQKTTIWVDKGYLREMKAVAKARNWSLRRLLEEMWFHQRTKWSKLKPGVPPWRKPSTRARS